MHAEKHFLELERAGSVTQSTGPALASTDSTETVGTTRTSAAPLTQSTVTLAAPVTLIASCTLTSAARLTQTSQSAGSTLSTVMQSTTVTSDSASALSVFECTLRQFDVSKQLDILSKLFARITAHDVPSDFLQLAAGGMQNLRNAGRSNVIYLLAQAIGTMLTDNSDTLLPVK